MLYFSFHFLFIAYQLIVHLFLFSSLCHPPQHHSCRVNSVLVQGVDSSKGFFLVDPDSNLPSTQERVKGPLAETGWQGITARRPTHDEFREAISANDLFV